MADVAQPKPGDIAPQQSSQLDSADRGKLRVFISYSRDDLRFADQLDAALNACGFECVIDRHGISGGEDWKQRLGGLISEADTVTKKEVFALFQEGADRGNATSMTNLGWLYDNGFGVAQDYAKAREWYEKAADKGDANAMTNLGWLYSNGQGVAQDYAKARDWYEKAADKDDANAMYNLGLLYAKGQGMAQDYARAREWYKKAADKGDEHAPIVAALLAREFTKALAFADRARSLFPDDLIIESYRAHALMFLGRGEESRALYLAHKGEPVSGWDGKLWERVIVGAFSDFREAGLTHPMMADIEKEFGVSP